MSTSIEKEKPSLDEILEQEAPEGYLEFLREIEQLFEEDKQVLEITTSMEGANFGSLE